MRLSVSFWKNTGLNKKDESAGFPTGSLRSTHPYSIGQMRATHSFNGLQRRSCRRPVTRLHIGRAVVAAHHSRD